MRRHAQGQAGGLAGGQVNAPELHELAHRLLNAEGQIGRWACVYLGDVRSRAVADIGDAETYVDPAVAGCRDVQPGVGEPGVGQAVPEGEQRCHSKMPLTAIPVMVRKLVVAPARNGLGPATPGYSGQFPVAEVSVQFGS